MGVLKDCFKGIETFIKASKTLSTSLAKGTGRAGARAAPPQTSSNDSKYGGRIDFGEVFTSGSKSYQNLNFQLNKQAKGTGLKDLIKKNGTHHTYATGRVEVTDIVIPKEHTVKGKTVKYTAAEIKKMEDDKKATQKQRVSDALKAMKDKLS